jgi:hypothetical protein
MAYQKSKVSNFGEGGLSSSPPLVGFEYCHQVSGVPGEMPEPGSLAEGELALNSADNVLYHRDGQFPGAVGVKQIVTITQAAYDALAVKSATTLYIVTAS